MEWRTFEAMGTSIAVLGTESNTSDVRRLFEHCERRLSRFRPDSELNRVNRSEAVAVQVSRTLADVLAAAAIVRDRTNGLVDPAAASRTSVWGYDRTFFQIQDLEREPEGLQDVPAGNWCVADNVLHRDPGVTFDLGGIAKGWAADTAMAATDAWAVNAGGDLRSRHPELDVQISDPWEGLAATVRVGIGGLATSSIARRSWSVAGRNAHHLIDPRTGRPAITPVIQATATAATAVEAEAAAKALILHDAHALVWASAAEWVRSGLVVWNDGSVYATGGLEVAA
jgi:thiamine biosynthesis lipoprotein